MIHDLNLSQGPTRRHADPSQVGTTGLRCCLLRRPIFLISYGSSYFLLLPSFLIRFSFFFVLLSWLKTRSSSRNHRKGTTGEGAGGGIGVWPYHFFILSLISCDLFSPPIALCVCVLYCCIVGAQPYIWWHTCECHLTDRCHKLSCCTFHCQCSYTFRFSKNQMPRPPPAVLMDRHHCPRPKLCSMRHARKTPKCVCSFQILANFLFAASDWFQ